MGLVVDFGNAEETILGLRVDDDAEGTEIGVLVGLRDVVAVVFLDGVAVGFFVGSGCGGVVVSMGFAME